MFLTFVVNCFSAGLGSSTSSNLTLAGAPQPAPETTGLSPVQFYKTIMSDDGAAPSFLPPKSVLLLCFASVETYVYFLLLNNSFDCLTLWLQIYRIALWLGVHLAGIDRKRLRVSLQNIVLVL